MIAAAWGHLWPSLVGAGVAQAVGYFKLRTRIAEHHLAQDIRLRRLAERVDELGRDVKAAAGKVSDDLAGLAETIAAVVRDQRNQ